MTEKKQRQILAAQINFISLCKRGKNRVEAVYKADDPDKATLTIDTQIKLSEKFDEEGLLYACIYPPLMEDADLHWADQNAIRDMAHNALAKGVKLDLFHDEQEISPDRAALVESTIIQASDSRFGDPAKLAGGWGGVIRLTDPALRKRYRDEGWNGVSMAGTAVTREAPLPETVNKGSKLGALVGRFFNLFGDTSPRTVQVDSPEGTYHITFKV